MTSSADVMKKEMTSESQVQLLELATLSTYLTTTERNGPNIRSFFPKCLFFLLATYHLGIICDQIIHNTNMLCYTYDQDRGKKGVNMAIFF